MAVARAGFPPELVSQPWSARIHYFQAYMMAHPRLVATREALLNAIHEVPANSLILVFGPTGVGKTTLRVKVEQLLAAELLPMLEADRGRLPVVSVECVAPESGSFSWRDHFRRLLLQMDEPLVDYKINTDSCRALRPSEPSTTTLWSGRLPFGVRWPYLLTKRSIWPE